MKPILLTLLALFVCYACDSNEATLSADQVPTAVRQAFAATSPDTKVEWGLEADGTYEAEYTQNGQETSSRYSATGELLETEIEIEEKELPAAILQTIATQFPGHDIEEAARINYPDGRVVYEAELNGDSDSTFDVLFAADGMLIEPASPDED